MVREKKVFLVHKYETSSNKHEVYFGRDLNKLSNMRSFNKLPDAKRFAIKKAKQMGLRTVTMDLPEKGHIKIIVPMSELKAWKDLP